MENRECLIEGNKDIWIEVNADKTKYVVMFVYQIAGQSYIINVHKIFFERVQKVEYLGTALTNQNYIQ
jgi:hypothetical protein